MNVIELLAATISLGGTLASLIIAGSALQFLKYFKAWRHEQRQSTTIQVLAEYRKHVIFPSAAAKSISPKMLVNAGGEDMREGVYELYMYLNSMEYLSMLIRSGAVDEETCGRFLGGDVVRGFKRVLGHILALREACGDSTVYAEFEALARKWDRQL